VESPTSSESPPIESNSAETVTENKPLEFKEVDGFKVDVRSKHRFLMVSNVSSPTAVKCPGCSLLTIHNSIMVVAYDASKPLLHTEKERISKRVLGCTNCGYIRMK
jgi:hypothetical protein